MPKVNYGFKGEAALTATQAIAAGATINSQEYQYTAQLNVIAPILPPGAPTGVTVTAGNGQIAVAWTAPANNGGSEVTGYVVEYTPAGGFAQTSGTGSTGTTFTLNSVNSTVTNGVTYSVRVAATNAAGQGAEYSTAASATPTAGSATALTVVSGSPTGSGTAASPYLVAADTSPPPVYKATGPGQFSISYTQARTYTECGKTDCTTYRRNDAVWFDRTAKGGSFWEKIRSNLDHYVYDGNNRANITRNQALLLKAATYMGQQMQCRSNNAVTSLMQPATARVAFQPQDANFSITPIGSRPVFGSGTAEQPYITQTAYFPAANERTLVFRANGSGVVCLCARLPSGSEATNLWVGGTASSFTGGTQRTLDSYHSIDQYGIFPSPALHYVWVNDGEIFSLAQAQSNKEGSWIQEQDASAYPVMAWAAPTASQSGLYLMNYGQAFNMANQTFGNWGGHHHATSPTLWTGLGTAASPLNMPTWSKSVPQTGHVQNLYASRDGTFTFNFESQEPVCWKESCTWEAPAVVKSVRPGFSSSGFGIYSYITPHNYFSTTNGTGSGTFSVKAFTGINFVGARDRQIPFRITNLVFTPS
jgi:hypothetical protein